MIKTTEVGHGISKTRPRRDVGLAFGRGSARIAEDRGTRAHSLPGEGLDPHRTAVRCEP